MYITPLLANLNVPQAVIDSKVNELLLTMTNFSRLACTDGKFYGVETECDTCGNEYNECLRLHLIEGLLTAHAMTEKKLGYAITPRFFTETVSWDGYSRIQTKHPGVSAFNVVEAINSVSGDSLYPVSPYLIEDAPLVDSESGYCIVQISRSIVDNPDWVILRDAGGAKIEPDERFGFPRRTTSNWELALPSSLYPSPCDDGEINVQHCKYISVVTDKKTVASGEVFPVYPGTNQKIPLLKPAEEFTDEDDNEFVRYWFYVWDLLDPAFFEEGMSWLNGEFYKLLENIELKNFTQAAGTITVKYLDLCCLEETRYATMTFTSSEIVNSKFGIVELFKNGTPCSTCSCCDDCKQIVEVTYSYKTDPSYFITDLGETLLHAMAYLVAAELPLKVCKCDTQNIVGFIQTAQTPYQKVTMNIYTGVEISHPEIGDLYGEREYIAELDRLLHYRKLIKL